MTSVNEQNRHASIAHSVLLLHGEAERIQRQINTEQLSPNAAKAITKMREAAAELELELNPAAKSSDEGDEGEGGDDE